MTGKVLILVERQETTCWIQAMQCPENIGFATLVASEKRREL